MFSRTDSESELCRLNGGEIKTPESELKSLIETGLSFSRLTDGAFDITLAPLTDLWNIKERKIPPESSEIAAALRNTGYERVTLSPFSLGGTEIDLGAVAKGYIADRLRKYFNEQGVNNVICDLGGNVMLSGEYTVGIQSPFSEGELFAVMRLRDTNAVTSGAYQRYFEYNGVRYHHILDARTGSCAGERCRRRNGCVALRGECGRALNGDFHSRHEPGLSFAMPLPRHGRDCNNKGWRISHNRGFCRKIQA